MTHIWPPRRRCRKCGTRIVLWKRHARLDCAAAAAARSVSDFGQAFTAILKSLHDAGYTRKPDKP